MHLWSEDRKVVSSLLTMVLAGPIHLGSEETSHAQLRNVLRFSYKFLSNISPRVSLQSACHVPLSLRSDCRHMRYHEGRWAWSRVCIWPYPEDSAPEQTHLEPRSLTSHSDSQKRRCGLERKPVNSNQEDSEIVNRLLLSQPLLQTNHTNSTYTLFLTGCDVNLNIL